MRNLPRCLLLVSLGAAWPALAAFADGPAYQVADIAPNHPVEMQGGSVYPGGFQPVTNGDVFLAPAGAGFPSIWRTDGTPEGTRPVVAGASLGYGELIGSNGQRAYFAGLDGGGIRSVWATDGTSQGTALLKLGLGVSNDPGYSGPSAVVVEGRLFFHDCAPRPSSVCDLWTSDGTIEGTERLAELGRLARGLSGSDGLFYFLAPRADNTFQDWLWRTDGTAAGTVRLREFEDDGISFDCASVGGEALVAAEGKLWITSSGSVEPITTFSNSYFWFYSAAKAGDVLYFLSYPLYPGTTLTVWRSDGTASGTSVVLSTTVLNSPSTPWPWVQQHGSRTYFLIPGPQGREPYTLWSSEVGDPEAQPVSCGGCSSIPDPAWVVTVGGELYFPSAEGDLHTLWAVDGTHHARGVLDYCVGYCRTGPAVAVGEGALFRVETALGSSQLWVSDGTGIGTRSLGGFRSLYNLYGSSNLGAALFAASPEFPLDTNLWTSRGTPETTVPLVPLEGEGSELRDLRRAGDRVVFAACREPAGLWGADADGAELTKGGGVDCYSSTSFYPIVSAGSSAFFGSSHTEVWATEGSAATTRRVWDAGSAGADVVHDIFEWGPGAAFWAYGRYDPERFVSYWQSDGTADGATRSFDLPLDVGPPYGTTALGDELYFRAQSPDFQVWRTDGSLEGTRKLTASTAYGEFVGDPEYTRVGAFVYFVGGQGIWRTDGTAGGTSLAIAGPVDDDLYGPDGLSWLHELGGALLFQRTENGVSTLWRTLGTPATTQQIAALDPNEFAPRSAAAFAGELYFAASDGVHGVELWRTDGSAAGTVLVRDIAPGPVSSNPRELVVADGRLLFAAEDPFHGSELWLSDGSSAGTHRVQDIAPEAASSAPADLTLVGDLLYFSADDAVTGRELWALPLAALPEPCAPGETQLCLGGGRFRVEVEWSDFAGNSGQGHASPLANSADTGFFWFFDASIVELVVKVIDGRDLNGHFWVYYGALSNVEYTITITDTETDEVQVYRNPSGTFASEGDILAFPSGEAVLGAAFRVAEESRIPAPSAASAETCTPSSSRLCLLGGRFAVEVEWTDFAGNSGVGTAVPLSGDTGYFWFFSSANVEVVAKVVDGRPLNGSFWVFYGALSNVEYTLTVTDTVTGLAHEYRNPSGHFASVGDIDPF